ncbi:MAG: FAD-dependent oxidoreductase [Clostridia bacterium]|nr:FAD-dependent oxidoreductase [Clostridia bacterium]
MKYIEHTTDLCVVGGGIAGLCTAVSAARNGIKVILMQDRPVLGGNASSEIRMWMGGAKGKNTRETGIVEEMMLENYYINKSLSFNVWDDVLYGIVKGEENITLLLNCSCLDAKCENNKILSVKGWQMTSETFHTVYAKYYADCSGDSILAPLTGAKFMLGREAKSDFGETIPPDVADKRTMGMSILLQPRETDHKCEFIKPEWAYTYEDDKALGGRGHMMEDDSNFWWLELGGMDDSIHDTDKLHDELLKIAYGVWDHVKNKGDHGADNWELDWVGAVPGKRESRRYVGEYIVNQNDVEAGGKFDDAVAYAGWSMDDHFPEGFYYSGGHPTIYHPAPSPWCLPLRALYSKETENLVFAGRNISVTHAALSSCRVMATCGTLGQAIGTAVALSVKEGKHIRDIDIGKVQQTLLYDDSYIPGIKRIVSELTKNAKTAEKYEVLKNGEDRPQGENANCVSVKCGEDIVFSFDKFEDISEMRIIFDSNLNRPRYNMPCMFKLHEEHYKVPKTLVKSYRITAHTEDGDKVIYETARNRQRMNKIPAGIRADSITITPLETWGNEEVNIFSVDFI